MFLGAFALCVAFFAAPAESKEYCPAELSHAVAIHAGKDGLYSASLLGERERLVSATVMAQTDKGWYSIEIPEIATNEYVEHFKLKTVAFDRAAVMSPPFYVQFPTNAGLLRHWYVLNAQSYTPDDAFPNQVVACGPQGETSIDSLSFSGLHDVYEPTNEPFDWTKPPAATSMVLHAKQTDAPHFDCAQPFQQAKVQPKTPRWPSGIEIYQPTVVLVRLSINDRGGVDDAKLWVPSAISRIDEAAVAAATQSSYRAPIGLCHPVPGHYLFRAFFSPD